MMFKQVPSSASHMGQFLIEPENGKRPILLRIAALSCGAVRVTRTGRDFFLPDPDFAVVSREPGTCSVTETECAYHIDCGEIRIQARKDTGALTFLDREERVLLREDPKRPCQMVEKPVMVNRFHSSTGMSSDAPSRMLAGMNWLSSSP